MNFIDKQQSIMWDDELLIRARIEQAALNTARHTKVMQEDVQAEKEKLIGQIQSVTRRRAIHKVAEDLARLVAPLQTFMNVTLEHYHLQQSHHDPPSATTTDIVEGIVEELRGAIYQMVFGLSQKNIRVQVMQSQSHLHSIQTSLAKISNIMQDDTIELEIDMDCSRDEAMARALQRRG